MKYTEGGIKNEIASTKRQPHFFGCGLTMILLISGSIQKSIKHSLILLFEFQHEKGF